MVSLLDSTTREMLLVPMPAGDRFFIRRKPDPHYPDDAYILLLTIRTAPDVAGPSSLRPIERGNYAWALRKTRELRIPEANIEHNETLAEGIDDGYEGWHLNARIVRGA